MGHKANSMSRLCLALVSLTLATQLETIAAARVFSDPAIFERVSHFKDVGVPNTLKDPFNRAAIADGSCRAVASSPSAIDGYFYWHYPERVDAVITALAALPSTTGPSNMTLRAKDSTFAVDACLAKTAKEVNTSFYDFSAVKGSMQNWWRALCQSGFDDPAYQPQQMALTVGYMCAITCDSSGATFDGFYGDYAYSTSAAQKGRDALCDNMPGYEPDMFSQVHTWKEMAYATGPVYTEPCQCGKK